MPATCQDGVKNGLETDIDCGGACADCGTNKACSKGTDCVSGVCRSRVCKAPACNDAVKNGPETDVDCGGTCRDCAAAKACAGSTDCASGVCAGHVCRAPACNDGIQNGAETDIDCGLDAACDLCSPGGRCKGSRDCDAGPCVAGWCSFDATFTDCGKVDNPNVGPLQSECDAAYAAAPLAGRVLVASGIQEWIVPSTATYRIDAAGAQAGDHDKGPGGLGATLSGEFALAKGDVLRILVGRRGQSGTRYDVGGGGGTYVVLGTAPLLVAGGGGGAGNCDGGFDPVQMAGKAEAASDGLGGAAGNDGLWCGSCGGDGSAGGGFETNGAGSGGAAFVHGGTGASTERPGQCEDSGLGGFGGGGNGGNGGAGGGGYQGGDGGGEVGGAAGKGGLSFNAGLNPAGTDGANSGAGWVRIRIVL